MEINGTISQSHQPPLYYLVGAVLVSGIDDPETVPKRNPFWAYYEAGEVSRDNKNQFMNPPSQAFPYKGTALSMHLLRLWSVALALGTVVAVWLSGQYLWPSRPMMVAALLALSVLNPMFLYISGAVNNDSLVILCGAFVLWLSLRGMSDGFSWSTTVFIGLFWSLALLTKVTGLVLAALWGTALIVVCRPHRNWHLLLSRLAVILGIVLFISGWWFLRNMALYGEPFALERQLSVWGSRLQFKWSHIIPDLSYAWTTFWGRFGYGQVPIPRAIYWALFAVTAVAVAGLAAGFRRSTGIIPWRTRDRRIILVLAITTLLYISSLIYYIFKSPTGANGRYVFPVLPAFAVLLVMGLTRWIKRGSYQRYLHISIVILMLALAIYLAVVFLPATYSQPPNLSDAQTLEHYNSAQQIIWSDQIELLGVSLGTTEVVQGEEIELTACWTSLDFIEEDYVLAIHLLDSDFQSYGQIDTYHGQGSFPTSYWQPDTKFCDDYNITVSNNIESPLVANVSLMLYDFGSGEKLQARVGSTNLLDIVSVGQVKLIPAEGPPTGPKEVVSIADFEQGLSLLDYRWSKPEIKAGGTISLTTKWLASGPLDDSYTIFAHLLDESGNIVSQADGLPNNGLYPSTFWGENEIISDSRSFQIPFDSDPGLLTLRVGFYLLKDNSRLLRTPGSDLLDSAQITGPTVEEK